MNCAVFLSRRKKQKALEATPNRDAWETVWKCTCFQRRVSSRKIGDIARGHYLPQPVAFGCLRFAASFIWGPAELIAKWQGMPSWKVGRKYQEWVKKSLTCCWEEGMVPRILLCSDQSIWACYSSAAG